MQFPFLKIYGIPVVLNEVSEVGPEAVRGLPRGAEAAGRRLLVRRRRRGHVQAHEGCDDNGRQGLYIEDVCAKHPI